MAQIIINNNSFIGKSITVNGDKIIIDGVEQKIESKNINIEVTGDLNSLEVSACNKISIKGNVKEVSAKSGDVEVNGNIEGDVSTMSGDVDCSGNINGNVKTMSGDIKFKK